MKIGIDTLFEHPERPSSVIDYLINLIEWLPRTGPEHSYYAFVSARNRHHFGHLGEVPNLQFVNCLVSNEIVPLRIIVQQSILPTLVVRMGLDVLYCPGNVCPLFGGFRRVLKINTLHHYVMPELVGRSRSLYRSFAFLRSAHKADRIVANTLATKEEICRRMEVPESKVTVVSEASYDFYASSSADRTEATLERYGLRSDYILFVSNLYRYKNVETLIRAFAKLPVEQRLRYELVVAGRDYESYQADLINVAKNVGIGQKVRFLGFVPAADLPALYTGARAFVYPSLKETFGKPLVEAMRCGVPIVASDTSSIPEVLGGAGLLVAPLDVDGMTAAICEAVWNEQVRANLIERGRARARCFSWEASAKETLRVIEEAVQNRHETS
jgi:glycosyltransferase involved in cell wall biosynthesis